MPIKINDEIDVPGMLQDDDYLDLVKYVTKMKNFCYQLKGIADLDSADEKKKDSLYFDVRFKKGDENFKTIWELYKKARVCLEKICNKYKIESTDLEFFANFLKGIKTEFSNKIMVSENNLEYDRKLDSIDISTLTEDVIEEYENLKDKCLQYLGELTWESSNPYYSILRKELWSKSLHHCFEFFDIVKQEVEKTAGPEIEKARGRILKDVLSDFSDSSYDSLDKNQKEKIDSEVNERVAVESELIRNAVLKEFLMELPEYSFRNSENILTRNINRNLVNFTTGPRAEELTGLCDVSAFLLNHILAIKSGLLGQGIAFDGYRFFNVSTGESVSPDKTSFEAMLDNSDREKQSSFVINEEFAKMLIFRPKCVASKESESYEMDNSGNPVSKTEKTVYDFQMGSLSSKLKMGYFVKEKTVNLSKKTCEIKLYYFCDEKGEYGIQLFRVDLILPVLLDRRGNRLFDSSGNPKLASHNQRGGEELQAYCHIHLYNLLDAVLRNYENPKFFGQMDIFNKVIIEGLDAKDAEELFDQRCGIDLGFATIHRDFNESEKS